MYHHHVYIPFLAVAGTSGLIFGEILEKHRNKKNNGLLPIVFLPFLAGFVEEKLPTPTQTYEVKTEIVVEATPDVIWANIVRVPEIKSGEYKSGFFNDAGIPKPLFAELDKDTVGATRIGHFEGGLLFKEKVTVWERNQKVAFDIEVIPSSIRKTVFDQHLLKGKHFTFLNAMYTLEKTNDTTTKVSLVSSYQLDTKINRYSSMWGKILLQDFQERLLTVIKNRCHKPK